MIYKLFYPTYKRMFSLRLFWAFLAELTAFAIDGSPVANAPTALSAVNIVIIEINPPCFGTRISLGIIISDC